MQENQMSNITDKRKQFRSPRGWRCIICNIYNIDKIRPLASSATRIEALKPVMMMLVLTHKKIYIYTLRRRYFVAYSG